MKIGIKKFKFVSTMLKTLVLFLGLLGMTLPAEGQSNGDFNNDGFTDLAVGVPSEDIGKLHHQRWCSERPIWFSQWSYRCG